MEIQQCKSFILESHELSFFNNRKKLIQSDDYFYFNLRKINDNGFYQFFSKYLDRNYYSSHYEAVVEFLMS